MPSGSPYACAATLLRHICTLCSCLQLHAAGRTASLVALCVIALPALMLLAARHDPGPRYEAAGTIATDKESGAEATAGAARDIGGAAGGSILPADERWFGAPLRRMPSLGDNVAAFEPDAYRRWAVVI